MSSGPQRSNLGEKFRHLCHRSCRLAYDRRRLYSWYVFLSLTEFLLLKYSFSDVLLSGMVVVRYCRNYTRSLAEIDCSDRGYLDL